MPQIGDYKDGKYYTGPNYGWQSPETIKSKPGAAEAIWRSRPGELNKPLTLPGLGTKVYTGKNYGYQLQATIDKRQGKTAPQGAQAAPAPQGAQAAPAPQGAQAAPPRPRPVPQKSARQRELDAINADKTLSPREKWAKANPGLAAAQREREAIRGTSETDNPLMSGLRDAMPSPSTSLDPKAFKAALEKSKIKPTAYSSLLDNPRRMKYVEAYDLVLDYLLSEGHADTVDEAHYVMMQLDSEYIQSIVEDSAPVPNIPPADKPRDKDRPKPPKDGEKDRPLVPPGGFGDLSKPRDRTRPPGGTNMGRGIPPNHNPNKYKKGTPTPGSAEYRIPDSLL